VKTIPRAVAEAGTQPGSDPPAMKARLAQRDERGRSMGATLSRLGGRAALSGVPLPMPFPLARNRMLAGRHYRLSPGPSFSD